MPCRDTTKAALNALFPRWGCFATTGFFPCGLSFGHCLMVLGSFKPICCYSVAQLCPTLCNPMDCSRPGFPVLHYQEFAQIRVHWVDNVIRGNQKQVVLVLDQPQRNERLSQWLPWNNRQTSKLCSCQHCLFMDSFPLTTTLRCILSPSHRWKLRPREVNTTQHHRASECDSQGRSRPSNPSSLAPESKLLTWPREIMYFTELESPSNEKGGK